MSTPADRSRWDSIADAAEHLGVSEKTIRNYIARGTLPAYRLGNRAIRIDRRDLDALLTPIPAGGGAR